MIRELEKEILNDIHFVERFIKARNERVKKDNSYRLSKKEIKEILSSTGRHFENIKNQYISDTNEADFTFRLIFDIKDDSILTYIYVLEGDSFLSNGLSNFAYMLNFFDHSGYEINQNFGINSATDFSEYINAMISIFEDFKQEFIKRQKPN